MSNPYEDWDEYDKLEAMRNSAHEEYLKTPEGKEWAKRKSRTKANENRKYFILIVLGVIILFFIIKAGGCNIHSSTDPYRR